MEERQKIKNKKKSQEVREIMYLYNEKKEGKDERNNER